MFNIGGSTQEDFPAITKFLIKYKISLITHLVVIDLDQVALKETSKARIVLNLKMAKNEESSEETLEALFSRGLDIHSEIESSSEDTNSKEFQLKVRKAILLLEDATR